MSYIVMECHRAYVVALDETGRFVKAANMGYQTGQRLSEVIELKQPEQKTARHPGRWKALASMAACFCLISVTAFHLAFTAYGTVRIRINPDVELKVNRLDYVIDAYGLNHDGEMLLDGWRYTFKKADRVSDQLTQKAEELGYLKENGTVHVIVTSEHGKWRSNLESKLVERLEESTPGDVKIAPIPEDEADDLFDESEDEDKDEEEEDCEESSDDDREEEEDEDEDSECDEEDDDEMPDDEPDDSEEDDEQDSMKDADRLKSEE